MNTHITFDELVDILRRLKWRNQETVDEGVQRVNLYIDLDELKEFPKFKLLFED